MKYEKNKLRLKEIISAMQDFHFLVKFGFVLIHILKVYRKKSSSILMRKNMFNSLLAFFIRKACTFSSFEDLETTPSTFLSKFSCELYLSRIIKYWGSIFTLYLTWGAFSLVCVLSVFFYLFLLFFFLCRYLPWQTLAIHSIAGKGEEIIIFLVFNLLLTKIHLLHWDFYHFLLLELILITRLIADETCFP